MKGFVGVACPLTDLTRKYVSFCWGSEHEAVYTALKAAFTEAAVLYVYDDELPHQV